MMFFAKIRRLTVVLGMVFAMVLIGVIFNVQSAGAQAVITAQIRFSQGGGGVTTAESISFYVDVVNGSNNQPAAGALVNVSLKNSGGVSVWSSSGTTSTSGNVFFVISPTNRQNSTGAHTLTANVQATGGGGQSTASQSITISSGSGSGPSPLGAPDAIVDIPKADIIFNPEVPLPTFAGGPVTGQTIAKYIQAVFVYFIWTVGLLAMFMIVYGGVKWVSAAGNPGRINDARETINNAIVGLIIALTSVLLLNTISPNLTNFSGITIKSVNRELLVTDNEPGENNEATTGLTKTGKLVRPETSCAVSSKKFIWPVGESRLSISSHVGPRTCPGCSKWHAGTDFRTDQKTGKPIIAVVTGTIQENTTVAGEPSVKLFSADGKFYTRYVHLSKSLFKNGDSVQQGTVIGYSGGANPPSTRSNGPHLHLELYEANGDMHDIAPCVLQ